MKINPRWLSLGLSLAGCAGVGITSWLSVKAHDKAKEKETRKEKIFCYWKAGVGWVVTSACIMGSHGVNRKEIVKLGGALTLAAANKDKIEKVVRNKFGPEKTNEIKEEAAKELICDEKYTHGGIVYEKTKYGTDRFFFFDKNRYFLSNIIDVLKAEQEINEMLHNNYYPEWNDFYRKLGIVPYPDGEELIIPWDDQGDGWNVDKLFDLERVAGLDGAGNPCTILYIRSRLRKEF